tara:strand:- start:119 stop:1606 length:1488 start_codon:yes stop_codon:yes gene_type:complete
MKIYKQEKIDGIADLVKSQASVAYCAQASVVSKDKEVEQSDAIKKLIAGKSNPDQIDLYYLESVLVSTGWNKNDDVFMAEATWAARNTPEDKQFNFMHNENDIIGHITGCYVLDQDGNKISDEQQEAPQKFDIISEAVLYNSWTDPDNRNRMQQIIAEIEEGKWFVSMECLFAGFDYALVDPDGNHKVLSRDEQSAFLTKHLRAYGGTGEYEGYTIGRALRNISFSGKGLVAKPANPRSIIINNNSTKAFHIEHNDDNKFSIGDLPMSDNQNLLETQVASLKQDLAAAQEENKAIKAKIEEAKDKEFAATIEAFEADVTSKDEAIAELEETIKSTQARIAELEDALAQSQEKLATSQAEVEEMHKKEKAAIRKAALVEAGLEEEEAEESLANFDALEDEAFDAVVALMKKKDDKEKKKGMPEEEARKKYAAEETEAAEEEATDETEAAEEAEAELEEAFEEVESTEATLVEPEADELQDTRASIADWISSNVLNK